MKDGTEVIAGIGIDVMWHGMNGEAQPGPSDPIRLQKAVFKAVEAGVSGFLTSREYDEMRFSISGKIKTSINNINPVTIINSPTQPNKIVR